MAAFDKEFLNRKERVEQIIVEFFEKADSIPEPLFSAMKYSLTGGGKRLRPILLMEAYSIFSETETCESVDLLALAIECLHTYSLIHDDLPCMDNDDFRRGMPTNHKVYGEANAILAGDALLNLCYELIFQAIEASGYQKNYIQAGKLIADACGSRGLIAGQTLDVLMCDDASRAIEKLPYIFQHKTADLISAALCAGALVGGADSAQLKCIKGYGDNFGYSFQILDDILDIEEKKEISGNSFVKIYGLSEAKRTLNECITKANEHLTGLRKDTNFLRKLAIKSITRKE